MKNEIKVDTKSYKDISNKLCTPINAYAVAKYKFQKNNIFLLESLSGPKKDRKMSIVGLDSILNISIYEQYIKFSGSNKVIDFLLNFFEETNFTINRSNKTISFKKGEELWNILRKIKNRFLIDRSQNFSLSYFGYFTYEVIHFIEKIPKIIKNTYDYPLISLSIHQTFLIYHQNGNFELIINNSNFWQKRNFDDYKAIINKNNIYINNQKKHYPKAKNIIKSINRDQYIENAKKAANHIKIGDIYQIQLGHEIKIESEVSPFTIYQTLRETNPSPYMFLADVESVDLIGASPELYVGVENNEVTMRPIAGTIGKKDGMNKDELIKIMMNSQKEKAEHLMLVDLCRNDISRICKVNSLETNELMIAEEYSHLFHIVSNVKALIDDKCDIFDIIKATFPAGTMSGAPKVKAMEIIESFENSRRGVYAGFVGLLGFNGYVNTALAIRFATRHKNIYNIRASAGIVSDSDPHKEWMETLYKMSSIYYAITKRELINESIFN